MLSKLNSLREKNEDGFTLIELLIVVVIIGILAAIAIPIFLNQQKAAIAGTVKSDVRNTVTNVATYLTKNSKATSLPVNNGTTVTTGVDLVKSSTNTIVVDGGWQNYVVIGTNPDLNPAATDAAGITAIRTALGGGAAATGDYYAFDSAAGTYKGVGALA